MTYSSIQLNAAQSQRIEGKSFREISKNLSIPLSTVHLWTKDIKITKEQKEFLNKRRFFLLKSSRDKAINAKRKKKTSEEAKTLESSKKEIRTLSNDQFFLTGLALYWAEGFKKDHSLGFVNSDEIMVKFFLNWLYQFGSIQKKDVRIRIQINIIYRPEIERITKYWAKVLDIPIDQFQKASLIQSKKIYYSLDPDYYGMVRIRVIGSRLLFIKIQGWLNGLRAVIK